MVSVEPSGGGFVQVLEEKIKDNVVYAPVFLNFFEAEQAHLCPVLGKPFCHVVGSPDFNHIDAKSREQACDPTAT